MTSKLVVSIFLALASLASCASYKERTVEPISKVSNGSYLNPVLGGNFPDPFVLKVAGEYHLYATNGTQGNVQYATSADLVNWHLGKDALPILPGWARSGHTWAPEVIAVPGGFLLYYTVRDNATNLQCISVAFSGVPQGPFVDRSTGPLVNQSNAGGSIDASPFRDSDGQLYLYWKNDGNAVGQFTNLYVQKLTSDGLALLGEPMPLLFNSKLWEGSVIEAPTMHYEEKVYYLLYSAGDFASDLYAIGYATSSSATGPFVKDAENPLVFSQGSVAGPGHQCIVSDNSGASWLVYHAWTAPDIGDRVGARSVRIDPIKFSAGKILFGGVSDEPRPSPIHQPEV